MEVHPTSHLPFGGDFQESVLTQLGEFGAAARSDYGRDATSFLVVTAAATAASTGGENQQLELAGGQMNGDEDFIYGQPAIKEDQENCCCSCESLIHDRVLLQANGRSWHEQCLRCCSCGSSLHSQTTCFSREGSIFCKGCYVRQYGTKCASCDRVIHATDWVRRARSLVFHLACFVCDQCKRQLSTGEEFALQESRLLCKQHFIELVEGDSGTSTQKQKTKRVRTTFAEEQLQILQNHFRVDSNPDGADLERIANMTGLSKRVTQVWFQNSRARQKKYQGGGKQSDGDGNRSSQEPCSPTQKSEGSSDGVFSHSANSIPSSSEEAMADSTLALTSLQYE